MSADIELDDDDFDAPRARSTKADVNRRDISRAEAEVLLVAIEALLTGTPPKVTSQRRAVATDLFGALSAYLRRPTHAPPGTEMLSMATDDLAHWTEHGWVDVSMGGVGDRGGDSPRGELRLIERSGAYYGLARVVSVVGKVREVDGEAPVTTWVWRLERVGGEAR